MAATKKSRKTDSTPKMVEVLYQKMGNRWFAFSLVDEEVFVGSISQDEIDAAPVAAADDSAAKNPEVDS